MATARRQSNIERTRWRNKCREALCNHINSKLGLSLDPSQVRLHPVRDDPYRWLVRPGKEYLFEKNLSDQSVGAYKELYDGIDKFFEATPSSSHLQNEQVEHETLDTSRKGTISFTSQINELQVQKDYALQGLNLLKSQLDAEVKLRITLEEKLQVSYERLDGLKQELQKSENREKYFRNAALDYSQEIAKIAPALSKLTERTYFTDLGFL